MALTKKTLSRSRIRLLYLTIQNLTGRDEQAKTGDGKDAGVVSKPWNFSGAGIYAMGKTAALLLGENEAIERVITNKRRNLTHDKIQLREKYPLEEERKLHEQHLDNEFQDKLNSEILKEEIEVELYMCDVKHLNVETNKLPPFILGALEPMLVGEISG